MLLTNYLLVAFRRLTKHRASTVITASGLAVGFASCLLLLALARHEASFDRFHPDAENIFLVNSLDSNGPGARRATTPAPLGTSLSETFPEVTQSVRVFQRAHLDVLDGPDRLEVRALFADASFFSFFHFPAVSGTPQSALYQPGTGVLTAEAAARLFGDADPLGRIVRVDLDSGPRDVVVGAVVASPPQASSLQFDVVLPFSRTADALPAVVRGFGLESWDLPLVYTFVKLQTPSTADEVGARMSAHMADRMNDQRRSLALQPLTAMRGMPEVLHPIGDVADPRRGTLFMVVAFIILGVACVNFTALTISRAPERAKEVGVRKALGTTPRAVGLQFVGEALLVSAVATGLGGLLARVLLPGASRVVGSPLPGSALLEPEGVLTAAGLVAAATALGGSYPALFLSRLHPRTVFSGGTPRSSRGTYVIRTAVVAQFGVAIVLLLFTAVLDRQLRLAEGADYGFDADRLIVVSARESITGEQAYRPFKEEIQRHPVVESVTGTLFTFDDELLSAELAAPGGGRIRANVNGVADAFAAVSGLQIVAGRALQAGETNGVLVNETLARSLGDEVLGRSLPVAPDSPFSFLLKDAHIVGVVRDFHYQPLQRPIEPLVLVPRAAIGSGIASILVRVRPEHTQDVLPVLQKAWADLVPNSPFQYRFLQDRIDAAYATQDRQRTLLLAASVLALTLAGLGLYGLTALAVARRRKEIGIRRVLGAGEIRLSILLVQDLLKPIGAAFLLSLPAAYVLVEHWLSEYAYRVQLDAVAVAVVLGLLVLVFAAATAAHTWRAATTNPINVLRTD